MWHPSILNQKGDHLILVALECLVCRSVRGNFRPLRGTAIAFLIRKASVDKTGTGWNELTDDHVLLQAKERIGCGTNRRACQHLDGVLERGGREERIRAEGCLGNTQ